MEGGAGTGRSGRLSPGARLSSAGLALGGGNPAHVLPTLHHLGCVELALGNLAQARRLYQEMMTICEKWSFQYGMAAALTGLARVALAKGELSEARTHLLRLSERLRILALSNTRSRPSPLW